MFTTEQWDEVWERVLALARSDPRVTAGTLTGSSALGTEDHLNELAAWNPALGARLARGVRGGDGLKRET